MHVSIVRWYSLNSCLQTDKLSAFTDSEIISESSSSQSCFNFFFCAFTVSLSWGKLEKITGLENGSNVVVGVRYLHWLDGTVVTLIDKLSEFINMCMDGVPCLFPDFRVNGRRLCQLRSFPVHAVIVGVLAVRSWDLCHRVLRQFHARGCAVCLMWCFLGFCVVLSFRARHWIFHAYWWLRRVLVVIRKRFV